MNTPYLADIDVPRPPHLGGEQWKLYLPTTITVLFGKNGSGKSLLLRSIRDADPECRHYVVPERTGDLEFQPNFITQQADPRQRREVTSRNFVDQYRRGIIARIQGYLATRGSVRAEQLPGSLEEFEGFLNQLLPDFLVTLRGNINPPYEIRRLSDQSVVNNIEQLSSGEAQLITIALDILTIASIWDIQNAPTRLMLVDEPDAHIHPDLQVRFADFLIRATERFRLQTIIATHSTSLLAAIGQFGKDAASVVYLDRRKSEFRAERFSDVMKELAACLGGHALMGPLFGSPLLIVEGDDDYRIWSQVPRHHVINLSVIPSHGTQIHSYQRNLERIFAALSERKISGFALLDGDKPLPQPNPQVPQDHIRYLGLACLESENLFLTQEVLAVMGMTWEAAAEAIVAAAENYGAKRDGLLAVSQLTDRKRADIKEVIHQLAQILDPKGLHWTVRVAQVLGRAKPTGELAEFLGDSVVSSLWPES